MVNYKVRSTMEVEIATSEEVALVKAEGGGRIAYK